MSKLKKIMEDELGFSSFFSVKHKISIKDFKIQARVLIKDKKMIALFSNDAKQFIKCHGGIIHLPNFDFNTIVYVHESIVEKFIYQDERPKDIFDKADYNKKVKRLWETFLDEYEIYKKNTNITEVMLSIGIAI